MVSEILQFFDFQDRRHLQSWIFNFLVAHHVGRANEHRHTNLSKSVKRLNLTFFKMAAGRRHLGCF